MVPGGQGRGKRKADEGSHAGCGGRETAQVPGGSGCGEGKHKKESGKLAFVCGPEDD